MAADEFLPICFFFGPGSRVPKRSLVVLVFVVVVISSVIIHKAFLIRNAAQQNFAYTFMLIFPTDLRSQIFKLICNQ